MKDLYSKITGVAAIAPVNVLDATVPTTLEIDLKGYSSAVVLINHGAKAAGDTGTIDFTMTHADDDGTGVAGDYANVAAADVQGVTPASGVILNLAAAAVAAAIHKVGYIGGKRFLKIAVTESAANSTGTICDIIVVKGDPEVAPAA
jgi:hypothetical protein